MATKVLLVDDHKLMRKGLSALLKDELRIEIVGEAENGRMAIELASKLKPDVIIMDISLPDIDGIQATRQILADNPSVKIVSLSMYANRRSVERMLSAGASGYIVKDADISEVVAAINTVMSGKKYLSPGITGTVVDDYVSRMATTESSALALLTPRERETLQLLAEGLSCKEIAYRFGTSVKTPEAHRRRIMEKLDFQSIAGLTRFAISEGLIQPDS